MREIVSKFIPMFFYLNSLNDNITDKTGDTNQLLLDYTKIETDFPSEICSPRKLEANFKKCRQIVPFKLASPKMVLTDFCSAGQASALQKVISPKAKSILENFAGFNANFFPVEIYDFHNVRYEYYLLHFQERLSEDFIDFEKTIYSIIDRRGRILGEITGRSNLETDSSSIAKIKRFSFREEKNLPDFFVTPSRITHFISDKLANSLITAEVTGISIFKYDNLSDLGINTIRHASKKVY